MGSDVNPATSNGPISIGTEGEVEVRAGNLIVLKPGFHAESGSRFKAVISNDCSN